VNRAFAAGIAVILLIAPAGCDLFRTRDPQPPTQNTTGFVPADRPDDVLSNLKLSIVRHDADNYGKCFSDTASGGGTFLFLPSSGNFQGIFTNWSLEEERRWFTNLGTPSGNLVPSITFTSQQQINSSSSATEYTMNYVLYYPHLRAGVPRTVTGFMHLYLALDNQRRWSIGRWDDFRTTTDSTWSYLKAHF
jgi:hypothetical protein